MQHTVLEDSTFLFFEDRTCRGGCSGEQLVRPCPMNALMPQPRFFHGQCQDICYWTSPHSNNVSMHGVLMELVSYCTDCSESHNTWRNDHLSSQWFLQFCACSVTNYNQMSSFRICSHLWLAGYSTQTAFSLLTGWLQYTNRVLTSDWLATVHKQSAGPCTYAEYQAKQWSLTTPICLLNHYYQQYGILWACFLPQVR